MCVISLRKILVMVIVERNHVNLSPIFSSRSLALRTCGSMCEAIL